MGERFLELHILFLSLAGPIHRMRFIRSRPLSPIPLWLRVLSELRVRFLLNALRRIEPVQSINIGSRRVSVRQQSGRLAEVVVGHFPPEVCAMQLEFDPPEMSPGDDLRHRD